MFWKRKFSGLRTLANVSLPYSSKARPGQPSASFQTGASGNNQTQLAGTPLYMHRVAGSTPSGAPKSGWVVLVTYAVETLMHSHPAHQHINRSLNACTKALPVTQPLT